MSATCFVGPALLCRLREAASEYLLGLLSDLVLRCVPQQKRLWHCVRGTRRLSQAPLYGYRSVPLCPADDPCLLSYCSCRRALDPCQGSLHPVLALPESPHVVFVWLLSPSIDYQAWHHFHPFIHVHDCAACNLTRPPYVSQALRVTCGLLQRCASRAMNWTMQCL